MNEISASYCRLAAAITPCQSVVQEELLPADFRMGIASPVKADSFTDEVPDATTPSTGILSPGSTVRMSSMVRASVGTSLQTPVLSISSRARSGIKCCRDLKI